LKDLISTIVVVSLYALLALEEPLMMYVTRSSFPPSEPSDGCRWLHYKPAGYRAGCVKSGYTGSRSFLDVRDNEVTVLLSPS
jgi:hypothetical protein